MRRCPLRLEVADAAGRDALLGQAANQGIGVVGSGHGDAARAELESRTHRRVGGCGCRARRRCEQHRCRGPVPRVAGCSAGPDRRCGGSGGRLQSRGLRDRYRWVLSDQARGRGRCVPRNGQGAGRGRAGDRAREAPAVQEICRSRLPTSVVVAMVKVARDRAIGVLICERGPDGDLRRVADQAALALELTSGYPDVVHAARRRKEIHPPPRSSRTSCRRDSPCSTGTRPRAGYSRVTTSRATSSTTQPMRMGLGSASPTPWARATTPPPCPRSPSARCGTAWRRDP